MRFHCSRKALRAGVLAAVVLSWMTAVGAVEASRVTFNRDIAPILFSHCAVCHRPGGAGPFDLLTFADAKKRSADLVRVTQSRYMPPWLPEAGHARFLDERRLAPEQMDTIRRWATEGTAEGAPQDLPPVPNWPSGWQLGQPDLVVEMPEAFQLKAEGRDVYRNFVVPVPVAARKFVRAIEFKPGTPKAVHHAFIRVDRTRQSRRLDALDPEPGFPGMNPPASAEIPDGHFLSWQPGRLASVSPSDMNWVLEPGSDFVLQVHMNPTGRPEAVRCAVGLYFSETAPTAHLFKIGLSSYSIDIPAGATNWMVAESYRLPVDARVIAVLPHAHYLGHDLRGFALLPDGSTNWLIRIPDWNFNWQGDYRFASPVFLPKGSVVSMQFSYDNSDANPRNPNHPPQRVRFGLQSVDEMGELWLQLQLASLEDQSTMRLDYQAKLAGELRQYNEFLLSQNPNDARAHNNIGKLELVAGRRGEARARFDRAASLDPGFDEPHYHLGLMLEEEKKATEAKAEYFKAIQANGENGKARNNLGSIYLGEDRLDRAEAQFKSALGINPSDALAHDNLGVVYFRRGDLTNARTEWEQAARLDPQNGEIQSHLKRLGAARP